MRTKENTVTRDKLYEAAFRYKKAKIWKKMWDSDVFAVKLSSGEIGYVSIMGRNGEYNALGLYIGKEGFESYRLMANINRYSGSEFRDRELLLQQKCLQAALENKEDLLPEEVEETRAYAKKNGIRLSGKNAFPQFIKYEPGCHPWKVKTQEDMNALYEAMEAALLLADELESARLEELGIMPIDFYTDDVPLFSVKQGKLVRAGDAPLPAYPEEKYEYVKAENQIALAAVKKLPKKGIWESEWIRFPEPVQDNPEETPYYPLFLLTVESKGNFLLPMSYMARDETTPGEVLQAFADALKTHKVHPKEIRCRDERTYALLKDFCEKADIKIGIHDGEMPALDDAEDGLWEYMSGGGRDDDDDDDDDGIGDLVGPIFAMSKEELRLMPKPLVTQIRLLIAQGAFPPDIAEKLKEKLKGL